MAPGWLKMVPRRPQNCPRWPQEGPKMAQDSLNMVQWGGSSSKVRRPCLWQVTSVLNGLPNSGSPLGKRSIPQTPGPAPPPPLDYLCPCVLRRFFASVFGNVHHSRTVCPLWSILATRDCNLGCSKLLKKHAFYRSNSSKKILNLRRKTTK